MEDKTQDSLSRRQNHTSDDASFVLPTGITLLVTTIGLCLAVLCVALDNTIIATAIPKITDHFNALDDVGWYGSAYLLTTCAFQLFFGKLYKYFNIKLVFLAALFIFEVGSLICAVAPTSKALIIGRAIAGLGSAGIFNGAMIIIANTVEIERRPTFLSLIGGMYGIASIIGPLLGGAFTDKVSWRWCFYINLPLGGVTAFVIIFFLKLPERRKSSLGLRETFSELDILGTLAFVPAVVCLLIALQWGGTQYEWSNWRIILLFVLFGCLLLGFGVIQFFMGESATVPLRIARHRTVASGALFAFCLGGAYFLFIYYIPIWFQAVHHDSAIRSGIDTLPMVLTNVFGVITAGALTTQFGYYMPFICLSVVFMSIGAGLLTTFTVYTTEAQWVGYQILFGVGSGWGFQQTAVAVQTVLDLDDIPIGVSIMMFSQLLGGSVLVAVGQTVFTNRFVRNLVSLHIPGLNPKVIVETGATEIGKLIPASFIARVLVEYNAALVEAFHAGLIVACLTVLGAAGMEWKSVKGRQITPGGA